MTIPDRSRQGRRDVLHVLTFAPGFRCTAVAALVAWSFAPAPSVWAQAVRIPPGAAERIGHRLWQNEAGGSVQGLTSWNAGEEFASLGIGHFIWYPRGRTGPFEESFPPLLRDLQAHGVALPAWLASADGCPWPTRAAFQADQGGERMRELRRLLADHIGLQAQFAVARLEAALPKMLAGARPEKREAVTRRFSSLAGTAQGQYALVDYVNFKGEGTSPTERYDGYGWGLLQVLERMTDGPPREAFSRAADEVLTERVHHAPPDRHEERWLPGWRSRVATYRAG